MRNPHAYRVYLAMSAAMTFASAMMFTVLSVYYVTRAGMDALQLVLVGTVLEATVFVFEVPTGVVADTVSRRLSVIIGTFVIGAAFVAEGLIPVFGAIVLTQATRGLGETFLSGATQAWLADEIGEAHVGGALLRGGQIDRAIGIAGIVAGAALGSLHLQLPVVLGGALYVLLGLYLILHMPETGFSPTSRQDRNTWQTMRRTLRDGAGVVRASRILMLLLGVEFFIGAASEGFDRLSEAHFLNDIAFPAFGALPPVAWFGIIGVVSSLVTLLMAEIFRKRLEALSRQPARTAGWLFVLNGLSIGCVMAFALTGDFVLAVAVILARDVLLTFAFPLHNAWLIQNIDPRVRATVLSMNGQMNAVGQVMGGPGIGLIGRAVSIRAAIAAAGLLLTPALALFARARRHAGDTGEAQATVELAERAEAA